MNDLIFDKRYCNAIEAIQDARKEEEYEQVKEAGFDSEEVWEMWYECDEDIDTFIEYLNELEVQALCKLECQDEDNS